MYNDESCIFRKTLFKLDLNNYNKKSYKLDIFDSLNSLIDKRIRYCPKCIKIGYHSIHHQLVFYDKCSIHNIKLHYMCECNDSYLIRSIGSNRAYSCPTCNSSLLDVPDVKDGIIKIWKKPLHIPEINHDNIEKISVINYYHDITQYLNEDIIIDNKIKTILKELYMNGYTNISSVDYHLNINSYNNIQSLIHQYIIDTYGMEEYRRNRNYINLFYHESINKNNINIDIISAIFLLREISNEKNINAIYNYEMNLRNRFPISFQEDYVKTRLSHIVSREIKEYIYLELIKERFKQIKMMIMNKELIPAQVHIFDDVNTYPIFIVVKEIDGKETLYQSNI